MKQTTKYLSASAIALAAGTFFYAMGGVTAAQACGSGCEPPPPPPVDDCGCDDGGGGHGGGHGHGGGGNWNHNSNWNQNNNQNNNWNQNNNQNNNQNTNNNTNNNNVDVNNQNTVNNNVNVNVDLSNQFSGSATASASASSAASTFANAQAASKATSAGIRSAVFGDEKRGAGGSVIHAPKPITTMGPIPVFVAQKFTRKPVRGICTDAKGMEEAAKLLVPGPDVDVTKGRGELMSCLSGETLVVTIGSLVEGEGHDQADYTGGYVITCGEGETLHYGDGGRLACGASTGHLAGGKYATSFRGKAHFAQLWLTRGGHGRYEAMETTYAGPVSYSGGVGY
ncbi:hypothetical protein [Parvibaculum sp. MBR-TMA-1.3b-4.2]|jgi:hypothetical protein